MLRSCFRAAVALVSILISVSSAPAQCILANPSFELHTGGDFGGWNQFGLVSFTSEVTHGNVAAEMTGPNLGGWDLSAVWQRFDTSPGDQWRFAGKLAQTTGAPLGGSSSVIVNIEWRDSAGDLMFYESHQAVTPNSPIGEFLDFEVISGAAPAGAVATHLLVGVLQAPGDQTPVALVDELEFHLMSPHPDSYQWDDFVGGRTLSFSGYDWRVKGDGFFGPGPNWFSDSPSAVWIDGNGKLHLTVQNSGGWQSTEVVLEDPLGYGDYIFTTEGRIDQLDPNVILGLFIWEYGPCYRPEDGWWNPYNEIDIEFSRWGHAANPIMNFVVQPWDFPGNHVMFDPTFAADEVSSHAFRWLSDRLEYRSWRGGPLDETTSPLIAQWNYTGPHIPRLTQPRVHLNLWHLPGSPPSTNQEVVLRRFTFVPEGGGAVVDVPEIARPGQIPTLRNVYPNPFAETVRIDFELARAEGVEIGVYDVAGRLVRSWDRQRRPAGAHSVTWDGRDGAGVRAVAGTYFVRLRTERGVESRPILHLR